MGIKPWSHALMAFKSTVWSINYHTEDSFVVLVYVSYVVTWLEKQHLLFHVNQFIKRYLSKKKWPKDANDVTPSWVESFARSTNMAVMINHPRSCRILFYDSFQIYTVDGTVVNFVEYKLSRASSWLHRVR